MLAAFWRSDFLYLFLRRPMAVAAFVLTVLILGGAALAPWLTPTDPYDLITFSLMDGLLPPVWAEGGDPRFLLGTDDQGRDMVRRSSTARGCRWSSG